MATKDIYTLIEEGKIKRYFRVDKKLIIPGGIYHITQRAPGTEKIFIEDSDYLRFLGLLKEIVPEFNLRIFAFALLPNHLHLLLQIKDANLSLAMKSLLEQYAMSFNRKYYRKGHVFGGAYRPCLCNDDIYILVVSLYIHLNPFKAGLCDDVQDYRWFSLMPYLREIKKDTFINYEYVLKMLNDDVNTARSIYKRLLAEGVNRSYRDSIERPFAVDKFMSGMFDFIKEVYNGKDKDIFYFEEALNKVKNKKRFKLPEHKDALRYMVTQLKSRGYSITEIGDILNLSRQTIHRVCKVTPEV